MKRLPIIWISVLISLLAGCAGGDGLTKEERPCVFITQDGYCICRGVGNKKVWVRDGDYQAYYDSCYK